jgi:HEAT repeat protein
MSTRILPVEAPPVAWLALPPDLPLPGLFEPLFWVVAGLTATNLGLFVALVVQREQWGVQRRVRERVGTRLAPVIERLLQGADTQRAAEELRPVIARLGPQARPVAAWLVLDGLREADAGTRDVVRQVLAEFGAVELAERATRRWMPWRRALACEFLGTIGTEGSVDVILLRLSDRRAEVRSAAARALGKLGHPAAAGPLTELFLQQEGVPTGVAYDALSRLGAAGAGAFRQGLESPRVSVRVTSCFGIAAHAETLASGQAVALLEQRLRRDEEPWVRAGAASAMRSLPGDAAPGALLEAVHDPVPAVRRSAAKALAAFDDPAAVAALGPLTSDEDRETALRAAESLLALSAGARGGEPARRTLLSSDAWTVESARATAQLPA